MSSGEIYLFLTLLDVFHSAPVLLGTGMCVFFCLFFIISNLQMLGMLIPLDLWRCLITGSLKSIGQKWDILHWPSPGVIR